MAYGQDSDDMSHSLTQGCEGDMCGGQYRKIGVALNFFYSYPCPFREFSITVRTRIMGPCAKKSN